MHFPKALPEAVRTHSTQSLVSSTVFGSERQKTEHNIGDAVERVLTERSNHPPFMLSQHGAHFEQQIQLRKSLIGSVMGPDANQTELVPMLEA